MTDRAVELRRFDARAAKFHDEDIMVTRLVFKLNPGADNSEMQSIYACWKLRTRMQSYEAAVTSLKTFDHFQKANVTVIQLRAADRVSLVRAIVSVFPEARPGIVGLYGIHLKNAPFDAWWKTDGMTLKNQKTRMIDLSFRAS